jgi:hypothetical protein
MLTVIADHGVRHRGVGHGGVGAQVVGPRALAGATHVLGKHVHLDRVLAAVRSRHRGGADEGTDLDLGERDLADPHHIDIAGHMQFDVLAAPRLDGEHVAIDGFDGAANARRCGRLLGDRVKRGGRDHHDGGKRANKLIAIAGHAGNSGDGTDVAIHPCPA